MAHALVVPLPFQGHINPLLELSKKLVSAGFMVTFANTEVNHQHILKFLDQPKDDCRQDEEGGFGADCFLTRKHLGILEEESHELQNGEVEGGEHPRNYFSTEMSGVDQGKEDVVLRLVSLEEGLPTEFENVGYLLQSCISAPMIAAVERLVVRLLRAECPVSCLIYDFRLAFMQDIARKHALPLLGFWTQSAANFISNLLLARGFQAPPDDSTLITCMPGVPPHKRSEVAILSFDGGRFPTLSDEYLWPPFRRVNEPDWVVINTFEELERDTLDALQELLGFRPLTVGPLVGSPAFSVVKGIKGSGGEHDSYSMQWLEHFRPASILYIAFGTVATLSEEQLEEFVLGLEATRQPFFWVFRPDLCENVDASVAESLLQRLGRQGMIVPWAQQWHILHHPAVGGFLTHCGWNSTLEGIAAGVPMLGWAQLGDQFLNQRCIESLWGNGLGLVECGGVVRRADVKAKVMTLMQGDKAIQFREKSLVLKRATHDALARGGSSALNVTRFLSALSKDIDVNGAFC